MLPVDAQITARAPEASAWVTATVIPRSLNDPVGFAPSTFRKTWAPTRSDSASAGSSGVPPSSRVTTLAPGGTATRSAYAAIKPGQLTWAAVVVTGDATPDKVAGRVGGTGRVPITASLPSLASPR